MGWGPALDVMEMHGDQDVILNFLTVLEQDVSEGAVSRVERYVFSVVRDTSPTFQFDLIDVLAGIASRP